MARKSTNPSDTVEQLRQKVFSFFVPGERQANFRAAFTPSKNNVFSRHQLTSLYSRIASIIVSIVQMGQQFFYPGRKGKGQISGECQHCFRIHLWKRISCPLGFNSLPNLSRIKDMISWTAPFQMIHPRKYLRGVGIHSTCCLDIDDVCPICREGIKDAIWSLASTANKYVQVQVWMVWTMATARVLRNQVTMTMKF